MGETYYYPFGLAMAGISSKALKQNYAENKYKFIGKELQNKEFSDGSGLEWYDLAFRTHDPQIGRFLQVDPLADKYVYNTPYAYAENRVINGIDLEGLEWWPVIPLLGNNATIVRSPVIENVVKPGVEVGTKVGRTTTEAGNKSPKIENHHGIPRQLKNDPVVRSGRDGGFKFEGKENKVPVEKFNKGTGKGQHGNHPNYNNEVSKRLAEFQKENPNATPKQAAEFLRNIVKEVKQEIKTIRVPK